MARIERILPGTVERLDHVAEDVFDGPVLPDRVAALLATHTHILLVASEGPLVVGQCLGMITHGVDTAPGLYIDNLGVSPRFRRQGIGRALIGAMWHEGRAAGCGWTWLAADPDSDSALPFYRALGLTFRTTQFAEMDF